MLTTYISGTSYVRIAYGSVVSWVWMSESRTSGVNRALLRVMKWGLASQTTCEICGSLLVELGQLVHSNIGACSGAGAANLVSCSLFGGRRNDKNP